MKKVKEVFRELRKNKWNYLFLTPAALYTFIFGYATLPYMIIAFEKFDFRKGIRSPWVGLSNFEFFFKSSRAWEVTRNTVLMNVYYIIFGTAFAILLALLVNEVKHKYFLKVAQSTLLFPYFISWVIVSYILYALLSTDYGIFNSILTALHLEPISWYSEAKYWRAIIVIARIWKTAGYSSIIYLAVIAGIDSSIYEAAAIDAHRMYPASDGCGKDVLRRFRYGICPCKGFRAAAAEGGYHRYLCVPYAACDGGSVAFHGSWNVSVPGGFCTGFHYQLYCKKELSGRRAVLRARRRERNEKNKIVGNYHIYAGDSLFPVLHSADGACFHGIHYG